MLTLVSITSQMSQIEFGTILNAKKMYVFGTMSRHCTKHKACIYSSKVVIKVGDLHRTRELKWALLDVTHALCFIHFCFFHSEWSRINVISMYTYWLHGIQRFLQFFIQSYSAYWANTDLYLGAEWIWQRLKDAWIRRRPISINNAFTMV